MKTCRRAAAAVLVIVLLAGLLAGCSILPLKGTYKSTGALGETLTFGKDNKVTGTLFGISLNGEYEIDDDTIILKYTTALGIGATLEKTFERKGDSIWIDGTEFIKQS